MLLEKQADGDEPDGGQAGAEDGDGIQLFERGAAFHDRKEVGGEEGKTD
jgi:hypothetical protein